jgi:hypothetical protein
VTRLDDGSDGRGLVPGNVLIDGSSVVLTDYEDTLLSLSAYHGVRDSLLVPLEESVPVDVLQFGHVLFEMTFGFELNTTAPDFECYRRRPPAVRCPCLWFLGQGGATMVVVSDLAFAI